MFYSSRVFDFISPLSHTFIMSQCCSFFVYLNNYLPFFPYLCINAANAYCIWIEQGYIKHASFTHTCNLGLMSVGRKRKRKKVDCTPNSASYSLTSILHLIPLTLTIYLFCVSVLGGLDFSPGSVDGSSETRWRVWRGFVVLDSSLWTMWEN